jgi:hypothetical protein
MIRSLPLVLLPLVLLVSCAHPALLAPTPQPEESSGTLELKPRTTHAATREEFGSSVSRASFMDLAFASYEPAELRGGKNTYVFRPAVAIKRGPGRPPEFTSWPELTGYDWVSAAELESKKFYWGFLDQNVEGLGSEVLVVWSQDGGKTWTQLPSLRKNHFSDEFYTFTMDEQGNGYAALKRSGEGPDPRRGFDLLSSSNFGKTWSDAGFVPTDAVSAEPMNPDCSFEMTPHKKIPQGCALPFAY